MIGFCLILQQLVVDAYFLNPICGVSYESYMGTRITNGKQAVIRSAPFKAYFFNSSKIHCSGSIINSRYILTAAHCIEHHLMVRLGEHDIRTDPDCQGHNCSPRFEEYGIDVAAKHGFYNNDSLLHDIGLVKVNRTINFNIHIQPICLGLNPASVPNVDEYKAFGWGQTAKHQYSTVLQTTVLARYNTSYCSENLGVTVTQNQICAGYDEQDTCSGHSGGPLVTKYFSM
nr:serine protease grass isoform X2 [Drosophila suzukii]